MMDDQNLAFLNKFLALYQELIAHEGYGDMQVNIRKGQGGIKEVSLLCGREYCYHVGNQPEGKRLRRYKVVAARGNRYAYTGPEHRLQKDRRKLYDRRHKRDTPFQFRLERRLDGERRTRKGRRKED